MSLEMRLRSRIERRFQTTSELLRIGDLRLKFTRIKKPDAVLDQIVEEEDRRERISGVRKSEDELHLPYWAELWDSALGLGKYLVERVQGSDFGELGRAEFRVQGSGLRVQDSQSEVQEEEISKTLVLRRRNAVLDLGCGMGLSGAVAAALGARVMLVDLEAPALLLARLNTLPFADRARVRQLDWRRDRLDERFDLILGSDVLYERKQWDFLEPFWRDHLKPAGTILLAEPRRQTGDMFPQWINSRGWRLETSFQPISTRPTAIRIFHLGLK